jgi:hypothetical protein
LAFEYRFLHRQRGRGWPFWSSADAERKATELARTALLRYVERYLAGGNAQLSEYSDKKQPHRVAEQFDAILKPSPYIFDYDPGFYEYLSDYPKKHLEGVEDYLYWSKEKFGLKPVISVTHVSIYRTTGVKCNPHRLETDLRKSLFRNVARTYRGGTRHRKPRSKLLSPVLQSVTFGCPAWRIQRVGPRPSQKPGPQGRLGESHKRSTLHRSAVSRRAG